MLKQTALIVCVLSVVYLLWLDIRKTERPGLALIVPLIWMFLAGTREFSSWFQIEGRGWSPDAFETGNPVDASIHLFLILCAVWIVAKRRPNWGMLLSRNPWIWLFFLYGAFAIFWSDYTYISFKRWIKAFGTLIMALVVLTEEDPYEAFGDLLRRLTILAIPLSIILAKYYPEYGRVSLRGTWSYSGVAAGKNLLGQLCLLSGIYLLAETLLRHLKQVKESYPGKLFMYAFLAMTAYLFTLANSATSLICMIVILTIFVVGRSSVVTRQPRLFIFTGLAVGLVMGFMNEIFNLKSTVLRLVGRDEDLTSRHPMWEELIQMNPDPLFGAGYESFWLGERLERIWVNYEGIIQSHNGYLETYLNLGLIGFAIMLACIAFGLRKSMKYLSINYKAAITRIAILVVVVLYNWTEASFYGTSNMFFLFFVAAIDPPSQRRAI